MGCGSSAQGKCKDGQAPPGDAPVAAPAGGAAPAAAPGAAPAAAPADGKAKDEAKDGAKGVAFAEPKDDEDDDDNEIEMDDAEFLKQVAAKQAAPGFNASRATRCAVSGETVDREKDWKAPVYDKTADQEQRLTKAMMASFMFAALTGDDLNQVIKAFKETPVAKGTKVINQGDEVSSDEPALFVFESGKLSVFKKEQEGVVFEYNAAGQYFGDLALLYNAPRAATVIADEECVLWSIDRNTFNYLVKDAARTAVKRRIDFLEQVPVFKGLTAEEKASLSDVMQVRMAMKDEVIIKEGDTGKEFFILESGKLEARKAGAKVLEYSPKDYFGELALMRSAPRAADVVATELSKVLVLDSGSFTRICGNLEQMMKERAASYEGYEAAAKAE